MLFGNDPKHLRQVFQRREGNLRGAVWGPLVPRPGPTLSPCVSSRLQEAACCVAGLLLCSCCCSREVSSCSRGRRSGSGRAGLMGSRARLEATGSQSVASVHLWLSPSLRYPGPVQPGSSIVRKWFTGVPHGPAHRPGSPRLTVGSGRDERLQPSFPWLSALAGSHFSEGGRPACGLTSVCPHLPGDVFQQSLDPLPALIFPSRGVRGRETKVAKALAGSFGAPEDAPVRGREARDLSWERPGVRLEGAVRAERSEKPSQMRRTQHTGSNAGLSRRSADSAAFLSGFYRKSEPQIAPSGNRCQAPLSFLPSGQHPVLARKGLRVPCCHSTHPPTPAPWAQRTIPCSVLGAVHPHSSMYGLGCSVAQFSAEGKEQVHGHTARHWQTWV